MSMKHLSVGFNTWMHAMKRRRNLMEKLKDFLPVFTLYTSMHLFFETVKNFIFYQSYKLNTPPSCCSSSLLLCVCWVGRWGGVEMGVEELNLEPQTLKWESLSMFESHHHYFARLDFFLKGNRCKAKDIVEMMA